MRLTSSPRLALLAASTGAALAHASMYVGSIYTIFQFGREATSEAIAVRPNGKLLFTEPSPHAILWEIDPTISNGSARIVANFPNVTTALDVASIGDDIYAVSTGDVGPADAGKEGSFTLTILEYLGGSDSPTITNSISIPTAKLLNKITPLSWDSDIVLVSDSESFNIIAVNWHTGAYDVVLADEETMSAGLSFPIGVNGLRRNGPYLYYINSSKGLLNRVAISCNGTAVGPYEIFANMTAKLPQPDDFALLPSGDAFIAGSNEILHILADGTLGSVVAGGEYDTLLAGATSAIFGKGPNSSVLYVSTTGRTETPQNGTVVRPGNIVAIELLGITD